MNSFNNKTKIQPDSDFLIKRYTSDYSEQITKKKKKKVEENMQTNEIKKHRLTENTICNTIVIHTVHMD